MSDLKDMSRDIQRGKLRWILETAMPLRPDFQLYLDGSKIASSKLKIPIIKRYILGKTLKELPKPPSPNDLEVVEDKSVEEKSPHRFGFNHPKLGRITGYAELYSN